MASEAETGAQDSSGSAGGGRRAHRPSNRLGLDYVREAERLGPPPVPMIDVHTHIGGAEAARIYRRVADLYGIQRVFSMTQLEQVPTLQAIFGERMHFIAIPNYMSENRRYEFNEGFLRRIEQFHELGSRVVKFWVAPRSTDVAIEMGDPGCLKLDAPPRIRAMELAHRLGMIFMVHVADPDTWFATKYKDANVYGTKLSQYEPLERLLDRFDQPWIAAHMGGWPEDLKFIGDLLDRHRNLHLDASATKWMVRELGRHRRDELIDFYRRYPGRVLFGSDILTSDEHLHAEKSVDNEMTAKASTPEEAFDLYASRYWALRTMYETGYEGESPIADPDLHMVDPERFDPLDAPPMRGKSLPPEILRDLYRDAAVNLFRGVLPGLI